MRLTPTTKRHFRMVIYVALTTALLIVILRCIGLAHYGGETPRPEYVKIHVVEEHHEVMPYWFNAVKRGLIPAEGNILLHIDGHSDNAPPQFTEDYPRYRYPKSRAELKAMLQSNDMFIQSAIMAGMFKKFIWIWPKWDKVNHEKKNVELNTEYGEYRLPGATEDVQCICSKADDEDKHCLYLNRTAFEDHDGSEMEDFEITEKQCIPKGNFIYEEIHEEEALKKMQSGTWFDKDDSIVFDIDEDYFGCESAGAPLMQSGVPWILVLTLSELIDTMICPKRTKHENEAENFLMPIIMEAIKICKDKDVSCKSYRSQIQKYADERLTKGLKMKLQFLCSYNAPIMRHRLKLLVRHLLLLNRHQIQTIATTGLCMLTTPKSNFFNMKKGSLSGSFHICTGFNSPNDTIVIYHYPDDKEVDERIKLLYSIVVDGLYPNFKLVTICRSIRDGYTPRGHFETIEKGILGALRARLGQGKYDIFYDQDLLGGSYGWPTRHIVL